MTEYVVFVNTDAGGPRWQEVARCEARSADAAIRHHVNAENEVPHADYDGKFAAVPARSWKPVTVKVETKTALRFS